LGQIGRKAFSKTRGLFAVLLLRHEPASLILLWRR
jgi:hypothetical protein